MQSILLIAYTVLSQAIIGTFSSENVTESSELLVRNKRVLNFESDEDVTVKAGEFRFVVNIKLDDKPYCVGSILSADTVITSAYCASQNISKYQVIAGSINKLRYGSSHNVVSKEIRIGNHQRVRALDGVAILKVHPHFSSRYTSTVHLHVGLLVAGTHATIVGWGCYYHPNIRGTAHPSNLRSITVPIISHRECVEVYKGFYDINDEDLCIYDPRKRCGDTDFGAPLIIDGQLAGIYLKRAENHRLRPSPEVFVVLQHAHYNQWIRDEIAR